MDLAYGIPGDWLFGFKRHAKRVLDKWRPALIGDARANRHWAIEGVAWIKYIHEDSGEQEPVS